MKWLVSIVALAMLGLAIGCEKKEPAGKQGGAAPAGATTRPGGASTATPTAAPAAPTNVTPTTPTPAQPAPANASTTKPAQPAPAVDPAEAARLKAAEAAKAAETAKAKATADAQSKLAQIQDYIKNNKLDLADTALKQLEATKDQLPTSLQSQITKVRQMLDAARKSPVKLPGGLGI